MTHPAPKGASPGRALVVSLHDVSPLTRVECASILAELRTLALQHVEISRLSSLPRKFRYQE